MISNLLTRILPGMPSGGKGKEGSGISEGGIISGRGDKGLGVDGCDRSGKEGEGKFCPCTTVGLINELAIDKITVVEINGNFLKKQEDLLFRIILSGYDD